MNEKKICTLEWEWVSVHVYEENNCFNLDGEKITCIIFILPSIHSFRMYMSDIEWILNWRKKNCSTRQHSRINNKKNKIILLTFFSHSGWDFFLLIFNMRQPHSRVWIIFIARDFILNHTPHFYLIPSLARRGIWIIYCCNHTQNVKF